MIFIAAGHCGNGGISLFYDWFPPYSFHLGLFAFCSGYFYKKSSERAVTQYCIKKIKHLLLPLYAWNIVYAVLITIFERLGFTIGTGVTLHKLMVAPIIDGHQFVYNMGGWFVVPLFMIQIMNVWIRKLFMNSEHKEHYLVLFYFLLGITGINIANAGYREGWWLALARMLFFAPFFGVGIYYKQVLEKKDHLSNTIYLLAILTIQLAVILIYKKTPAYVPSWCATFTDGPILPYLVGFLGIAFWLRIARILEPAIGKSKTVNLIADNTFSIMINQFLGFMVIKAVFAMFQSPKLFADFDINRFKTDIWYIYLPNGINQMLIVYLFAGLFVPIIIQRAFNCIKNYLIISSRE